MQLSLSHIPKKTLLLYTEKKNEYYENVALNFKLVAFSKNYHIDLIDLFMS